MTAEDALGGGGGEEGARRVERKELKEKEEKKKKEEEEEKKKKEEEEERDNQVENTWGCVERSWPQGRGHHDNVSDRGEISLTMD